MDEGYRDMRQHQWGAAERPEKEQQAAGNIKTGDNANAGSRETEVAKRI